MAVSPADFELYSRATGTPLPRTPQEQMRLAPQVHSFIQNRGYQRGPVQRTAGALDNVIGGIRNTALIGAGLLGAGLAASAYANKRDSEPKTPDPDANRYDKAGHVDLSAIDSQIAAENAENRAKRPPRPVKIVEEPKRHVRTTVVPSGNRNYGNPVRDLASEAENLAINITGGGSDGNVSVYDPNEGGNIEVSTDYKPVSGWGRHRGAVEQWADDVILEKRIVDAAAPLATGIVGKNLVDFGTIATGGEAMGNQATEAITEGLNRTGLSIADKDPTFRAVHGAADAVSGGVHTALDSISSWGFGPGHTIGDLTQHIAQHGSNLPGVENVGNVLEALGQVSHNLPIEMALMGGTVGAAAAVVGGARGAKKTKEAIGNVVSKGKKQLERFKRVAEGKEVTVKPITEDHPQTNEIGADQTRTAPSVGITDESIQDPWENEGIGVGAHVESGPAEPIRDRVDKLLETASEYLGATDHFQGAVGPKNATGATWVRSGDGKLKKQEDPGSSFLRGVRVSPEGEITVSEEATLSNWRNRKEAASAAGVDKVVDEYHYPQYAHDDYDDPLVQQAKAHLLEEKMNQLSALDQGKPWGDFEGKTKTTPQSKSGGQWYNQELKGPFGGDKPGRYERSGMTDATYVQSRIPDSEVFSGESDNRADTATRMAAAYQQLAGKEDTPSRQMSYNYPLQGKMSDEEYFSQGPWKIANTANDNPDFDSEAYYDNKKKWIQDQMD